MKVLAVIGSPRKTGNTYKAVARIERLLAGRDNTIDFEYLFLVDYNLKTCTGCFNCIAKGEEKCPLIDDRDIIKGKMDEADGIIFAAPSYAMGVPAIFKNLIDRFAYTLHRPCFFDKVFLAVMTIGGVMGGKRTLNQITTLAAGAKKVIKLGICAPPVALAGIEKSSAKSIKKASKVFYKSLLKKQRKLPGIGDWAYFHAFKSFCAFECYRKVCPADVDYYQSKKEYFFPIKGRPFRRAAGKIISVLTRFGLKIMVKERQRQN
ncbi:MAG: NAD(P)H-dependent oxidoreductase [Christensenellales bacterium]